MSFLRQRASTRIHVKIDLAKPGDAPKRSTPLLRSTVNARFHKIRFHDSLHIRKPLRRHHLYAALHTTPNAE